MNPEAYELTEGQIKQMTDIRLLVLLDEMGKTISTEFPQTDLLVTDALQRMVARGSSPDVLTLGYFEALAEVRRMILSECARRWKMLRATLRKHEGIEI